MQFFQRALATAVVMVVAALPHSEAEPKCDTKLSPPSSPSSKVLLYAGTYTRDEGWVNGQGKGVYTFEFDTATGALTETSLLEVGVNPTFVSGTQDATRKVVYTINEVTEEPALTPGGETTGYVYALTPDESGVLTILNKMETGGNRPAHVSVSPNEDYVTVSNYGGGSVSIFPIAADGALQNATDFHQYTGSSGVTDAQDAPHMHCMAWVGKGSMSVLATDLGNDRVAQFTLDTATGKLMPNAENEFIELPAGSGPRHMAIHPTKDLAFVVNEIDNTVAVFTVDAVTGALSVEPTQIISILPEDYTEISYAADVHVSEDGKFVYASNRGHDSIAIFSLGEDDTLTAEGHEPTRGVAPRAFTIYENFLLVANQNSDSIEVFKIDPETGKLTYAEQKASVGTPVSLFIPRYA